MLTPRDTSQLYHQSYIEMNGSLYYATTNGETNMVTLMNVLVPSAPVQELEANPETMTSPINFQLGYLSNGEQDVYMARAPRRCYSMGWTETNTSALPTVARWRRGAKVLARQFADQYPTFAEAKERATASGQCFAFSRDFAVYDGGTILRYRGSSIARLDRNNECSGHSAEKQHLIDLFNELKAA